MATKTSSSPPSVFIISEHSAICCSCCRYTPSITFNFTRRGQLYTKFRLIGSRYPQRQKKMAICQLTLTRVAVVAALAYIGYNMLTFYTIFFPPQCQPNQRDRCILPAHTKDTKLEVREGLGQFGHDVQCTYVWVIPHACTPHVCAWSKI